MGEYFVVLNSLDKTGKKPTYGFFHRSRADNY